ncbi:hypothetical protein Mgra_00000922 [Meloidogyne graminicola]|uniref:receptor protein-tyrosine kinase n=1 Tax=Meloidogyne graminicola TaxID=189291 RepID=A0A8T0A2G1_9BILA|nr:hypothetical protein Mgra_00000922 [Meloidogyne graminicola]
MLTIKRSNNKNINLKKINFSVFNYLIIILLITTITTSSSSSSLSQLNSISSSSPYFSSGNFQNIYSPPRFKQNARTHQFAYLGDSIKFKCNSVGRPQPKVHWYRNGKYMNYSYLSSNSRLKEKGMTLEVQRIEISDRGNWTCRVWNKEGSVSRNYTLHIVDFCDYFLNVGIHASRVPEECLCQWVIQHKDAANKAEEDPLYHLRALPQLRADINLSGFLTNFSKCQKYNEGKIKEIIKIKNQPRILIKQQQQLNKQQKNNNIIISHKSTTTTTITPLTTSFIAVLSTSTLSSTKQQKFRPALKNPVKFFDYLAEGQVPEISHLLPNLLSGSSLAFLRKELPSKWHSDLDLSAKLELSKHLLKEMKQENIHKKEEKTVEEDEDEEESDEEDEDDEEEEEQTMETTTKGKEIGKSWTDRNTKIFASLKNKERLQLPQRVAPYFRKSEEDTRTNIAGGQPEPQVVWRKGNEEILRDSESKTGSLYQLRKWNSGDYFCEVFNSAGSILRRFRVEVQDRIRARPILVPNVLQNRTVDVNGTVNFTCQVISDLVPHIIWIKLIKHPENGSFLIWDKKEQRETLNFIDMSTLKDRVKIFHDKRTNRYTMELKNVSMSDQGLYSCVVGNTLGLSMGNATLTVNEFRSLTLPTEVPSPWPLSYTILLILSFLLLCAFIALCLLYLFFSQKFSAKNRVQNLDKMSVRKKVVITRKPQREGEHWSDLASTYSITVEPVPVIRQHGGRGTKTTTAGTSGTGDTVPLMDSTQMLQGNILESSLLSDYEVPTDSTWEIERNRLQLVDILGEGAFGEVWQALLQPKKIEEKDLDKEVKEDLKQEINQKEPIQVAIKRLKSAAQERELIILVSEMQILKTIGHHPNILRLIGCCTGLGPLLVVLELCEHGNLRDFMRRHRPKEQQKINEEEEEGKEEREEELIELEDDGLGVGGMYQNVTVIDNTVEEQQTQKQLTLRDLVQFATEIARGMEFLASKKIIHRDLAARNVLVSSDLTMKISDFGLSRNVFYHDYYRKRGAGRLPIKWMAPEALEANVYTVNSDVWSYGILLWEIMTLGGTPYPSIAMPQLYNLLKEGYRMEAPHNCPDEIYGVMVSCWQERPEARPAFQTIGDYFCWILKESEKTEEISRSETENGGETTDEGPYEVIPEGSQEDRRGNGGNGNNGTVFGGMRMVNGKTKSMSRPMSAPGLTSFESFSQEAIISSTTTVLTSCDDSETETNNNTNSSSTLDARRDILVIPEKSKIERRLVWTGSNASADNSKLSEEEIIKEQIRRRREQLQQQEGIELVDEAIPIYNNFHPQYAPSNFYANTPTQSLVFQSCSSTAALNIQQTNIEQQLKINNNPPPSHTLPPAVNRPKKKSSASEHGLRIRGVLHGVPQQNNNKLENQQSTQCLIRVSSSNTSFGQSPDNSSKLKSVLDWRSCSIDSSSSGRGGSSAMSSADVLLCGNGTFCEKNEEEKEEEKSKRESEELLIPFGKTLEYLDRLANTWAVA